MSKGQVSDPERIIAVEKLEVTVEHVTALEAHQDSNLSALASNANLGDGGGESEVAGMEANLFQDRLDLLEGASNSRWPGDPTRHPNGEKYGAKSAFFHARDVDAAGGMTKAKVKCRV
ncbi:MAG: hypothetical protein NVS9B4_20370 [Candidatus Acidiferrum sp.]